MTDSYNNSLRQSDSFNSASKNLGNNNEAVRDFVNQTVEMSIRAKQDFYKTQSESVVAVAQLFAQTFQYGGKVLIFGNGGSAADAQHMAAEMVGRMLHERKIHLPAIALTTDTSNLTAIANDYSYDDIFSFQVKALGRRGDVAVGISTSGNSKNVIKAIETAKDQGLRTVSFTGGTGGRLREITDINLNVGQGKNPSMIQETHITVVHLVVDLMDRFFLPDSYVVRK